MFSITSKHALRAMAYIATHPAGTALEAKSIAQGSGVPVSYLSKLLAELARAELLKAKRGAKGGYSLARPAEQIVLKEILERFDEQRANPECVLGKTGECSSQNACHAHARWAKVRSAYIAFIEESRLADIAGSMPGGKRSTTGRKQVRSGTRRRRG